MLQNNETYNSENNDNNGGTVSNSVPPVNETFNYGGNNFFVDIGKKDIQKFAVITGLPLIIVLLISNYWSRVLFFFTGFLPGLFYDVLHIAQCQIYRLSQGLKAFLRFY